MWAIDVGAMMLARAPAIFRFTAVILTITIHLLVSHYAAGYFCTFTVFPRLGSAQLGSRRRGGSERCRLAGIGDRTAKQDELKVTRGAKGAIGGTARYKKNVIDHPAFIYSAAARGVYSRAARRN